MDIETFSVMGITVRTINEKGKFDVDIPKLWTQFFAEKIIEKIPNKSDSAIYCVYTDYESDFTKFYTVLLGCRVNHLDVIPMGLTGKIVLGGSFKKFIAKGDPKQGAVYSEWVKIWNSDLNRQYSTDFEVYDGKSQDLKDPQVDIFIAIK